jgi:predicted nicotinamide N-methyase
MMAPCDAHATVEANTRWQVLPLCPELRLRLFVSDGPMAVTWGEALFHYDGPRPYWAFCWASGQVLARYILDCPEVVRGRRVIDIGAGSGVAAIAAAKAGALDVLAVDRDHVARIAVTTNAAANGVHIAVADLDLDGVMTWRPDLVLAADICYEDSGVQWLNKLHAAGMTVLVADPGRPGLPRMDLEPLVTVAALTFPELETPELTSATVYQFKLGR